MIAIELQAVGYGVGSRGDGATILGFQDPQSGITVNIPFSPADWENFQKEIAGRPQVAVASAADLARLNGGNGKH